MIIKETPWEKRNLGIISSIEITIEERDAWEDVSEEIKEVRADYQVMHIPGGNTGALLGAQKMGFRMIEMNLRLAKNLNCIEMPRLYRRFEPFISYHKATPEETDQVLSHIRKGGIFTSDKVSRDPAFGTDWSGWRYYCWTKDILADGAQLLCMQYKGKMIGFDICRKQSETIAEAFLGGLVPEYAESGLGFVMVYLISKYASNEGFQKIITGVSSNNIPILKLHELFGYAVDGCTYCLIKHVSEKI